MDAKKRLERKNGGRPSYERSRRSVRRKLKKKLFLFFGDIGLSLLTR